MLIGTRLPKRAARSHHRRRYPLAKRAMDLAICIALLPLVLPVTAVLSVLILIDSGRPIFFVQERVGKNQRRFRMYKFRTLKPEYDARLGREFMQAFVRGQATLMAGHHQGKVYKPITDEQITRIGRILRKTSLDELPQIFNVISGEMSLVGPRPHAIGMLSGGAEASKLVETYAHRHRIKPGLTGWAAVNGSRGPVDTAEDVRRRVALDLEYVERRSFWLDVAIILRTAPCLLGDSGVR